MTLTSSCLLNWVWQVEILSSSNMSGLSWSKICSWASFRLSQNVMNAPSSFSVNSLINLLQIKDIGQVTQSLWPVADHLTNQKGGDGHTALLNDYYRATSCIIGGEYLYDKCPKFKESCYTLLCSTIVFESTILCAMLADQKAHILICSILENLWFHPSVIDYHLFHH